MSTWFTWAFSGIGVYLLGYLTRLLYERLEKGLAAYREGYFCPHTLTYFSHGPQSPDGSVYLNTKRIMTLKALRSTSFEVSYPVKTRGKIDQALSLSHPNMMSIVKKDNSDRNTLQIEGATQGQYFIVASESERTITPDTIRSRPSSCDKVLTTLFERRLDQGVNLDFAGTRIVAKTDAVKLIVEFDPSNCPDEVFPINIAEDGTILREENNGDFIAAKNTTQNQRPFFVYRLNNPPLRSGFYLWWKWPEARA